MKKFLMMFALFVFTLPALAENTILIIGDSLSAGYGIDPRHGWVALLRQKMQDNNYHYQVVNDSISGDTTSNGLNRMPAALNKYHPQITIIELGGNDALRGLQLSVIKDNLQHMIDLAKHADSKIMILGIRIPPNYGTAYTEQFQQTYTDLVKANNVSFVPDFLNGVDTRDDLMQDDRIHPKETAQSILLNNTWPVLKNLL